MVWAEVPSMLNNLYQSFADFDFHHQMEMDVAVWVVVVGSLAYVIRRQRSKRRRLHRLMWGRLMKRKDLQKYQLMGFEDAIVDAAMEMVHRGDMTEAQEQYWFRFFAETCGMLGLKPQKDVKKAIQRRLNWPQKFGLLPVPGGIPGTPEVKPDPNYSTVKEGLSTSRFLKRGYE